MPKFTEAYDAAEIARQLIPNFHKHLENALVKYLFTYGKWTADAEPFGKAKVLTAAERFLCNLHIIIQIPHDVWERIEDKCKIAAVDHMLSHIYLKEYADDGAPIFGYQEHSLQDFEGTISRHGYWRSGLKGLKEALEGSEQLSLFKNGSVATAGRRALEQGLGMEEHVENLRVAAGGSFYDVEVTGAGQVKNVEKVIPLFPEAEAAATQDEEQENPDEDNDYT
jgi:hypothetical protein